MISSFWAGVFATSFVYDIGLQRLEWAIIDVLLFIVFLMFAIAEKLSTEKAIEEIK